tara:strand:- start:86 stop:214 length:129 start_codon:yes stop_codon:yes gene_type:complete
MKKPRYKKLTRKGILRRGGLPALKLVIKEQLRKVMFNNKKNK